MSLQRLIEEHVDSVFLNTSHFAETVLRYAGGDRSKATSMTAVVTWQPTDKTEARGQGYVRKADMLVNDSVTITPADAFKVGTIRMEVESVDPPDDGAIMVRLIQYEAAAKGGRKAGDI